MTMLEPLLGKLNHIAIAVPDLVFARDTYEKQFALKASEIKPQPEHGVEVVFFNLPNMKIELLGLLGEESPIAGFLERNPLGGIHHLCYEVENIVTARDHLLAGGARVLGNGEPKIGAHGRPVLFLHPKDFHGALIELEEV